MSLPDRVTSRIEEQPDGCWLWTASTSYGYGQTTLNGRKVKVHRLVYEDIVGPIPPGLELDHLCRVRACCNPAHLEPVTRRENLHRSPLVIFKNRVPATHCKHGHEFDPANTYVRPGTRERTCRTCNRLSAARTQRVRLARLARMIEVTA